MNKWKVKSSADALAYITDCTLATVASMAGKKSRSEYEFKRQKSIAQSSIDWMDEMHVDYSGTRAQNVKASGSVDLWAAKFDIKKG